MAGYLRSLSRCSGLARALPAHGGSVGFRTAPQHSHAIRGFATDLTCFVPPESAAPGSSYRRDASKESLAKFPRDLFEALSSPNELNMRARSPEFEEGDSEEERKFKARHRAFVEELARKKKKIEKRTEAKLNLVKNALNQPGFIKYNPETEVRGRKALLVAQYLATQNMSQDEIHRVAMADITKRFQTHDMDSGSSQVQVALLTYKIQYMTEHLKVHKKDKHGRKGLHGMLMRRQKLLKYMRRKEQDAYQAVLLRLGLKDRTFVESVYANGSNP